MSGETTERAPSRFRPWTRRVVQWLAVAYPASLAVLAGVLGTVGEKHWITTALLYLPRFPYALPLPFLGLALLLLRSWRLLALQAASLWLVLVPLMGFVFPWVGGGTPGAPTVRLLSYNVNSLEAGEDRVFEQIEHLNPDIVLLQEIGSGGAAFAERLRARYGVVQVSGQFIVASRHPILETYEPGKVVLDGVPHSPRFLRYTVETPLGRIALYNVHPISPRMPFIALRGRGIRREILSGRLLRGENAAPLMLNVRLRALQTSTYAARAAEEKDPVVIAGDTNLPGLSPSLRRYLGSYQDGFVTAGGGFGYTFPTYRVPWMRIDRVLVGRELRVTRFEIGAPLGSDHRAVVADVQRAR
ncbi:MAG TPA: endonuclease/exonuclease/phosphatase family protein [Polyangiaceae bacterium]|nr:endonuclease/exonuclease/phosphatase family protein [Polyangiaceae bacterium]